MKHPECVSDNTFVGDLDAFSRELKKKISLLENENKIRTAKYIAVENKIKKLNELLSLCVKISSSEYKQSADYFPYQSYADYVSKLLG